MKPKVVIIGAGFGGLATARGLSGVPVDVTLVDRNNFHTFLPLLYQVATAGLNAADVAHAVRGIVRDHSNVAFRQGIGDRRRLGRPARPPRRRRPARRSTTSSSPPAPRRSTSASPVPPSTPDRSTRSRTPSPCGTTSSDASRPPMPTRRSPTTARSRSPSSAAGPRASRWRVRWRSCSRWCCAATSPASTWARRASCCSRWATTSYRRSAAAAAPTPAPRSSPAASRCAPARPSPG